MDIIIRAARVIHPGSPYHTKVVDILISNGKIKKIAAKIADATRAKRSKHQESACIAGLGGYERQLLTIRAMSRRKLWSQDAGQQQPEVSLMYA
jgi:hypothetical protein